MITFWHQYVSKIHKKLTFILFDIYLSRGHITPHGFCCCLLAWDGELWRKWISQIWIKGITGSRLLRLICWIPHRLVLTFNYFFKKRHFPPKNDPIWKIPIGRKLSLCPLYWCMNWSHRECFKKKTKFWKNAIISTKISEPDFFFTYVG